MELAVNITVPATVESVKTHSVLISTEATEMFSWINYLLCEIIAFFGTIANIINIICFVKLGLKDPINVSFLGLALSDFGSEVTLLWTSLCFIPGFRDSDVPFDPPDAQALITAWPHTICTRVTSWITALITLERCLCITMPLKVRQMITPKRVAIIVTCIFMIITGGAAPLFYIGRFAWKFSPARNRTILRAVYTADRAIVEQISHSITNAFIPFAAYVMVIVCTVVLTVKMTEKTKWRLKSTAPVNDVNASVERDKKVAKMVVIISSVFIASFVPLWFLFLAMIVEPKISIDGQYRNTFFVLGGFSVLLESANSAMNVIIYYDMNSRYRSMFLQLCLKVEQMT